MAPGPIWCFPRLDSVTSCDQEGEAVSPEEPDLNLCQAWLSPSVTCGHPGCNYVAFEMVASITEWRRDLINQAVWCTQLDLPTELGLGFGCLFLSHSCTAAPFWIGEEGCQWAIRSFWTSVFLLTASAASSLPFTLKRSGHWHPIR